MSEVVREELSRVAFVYGDAGAAAHLRDALAGQVEIAYASTAEEFDAARASGAGVTAALVNVDGGDWLEPLQATLAAAGVRAVFNDPEISGHLEGWERARWLRHLVAKLRGARDFDPPRPSPAGAEGTQPAFPAQDTAAPEIQPVSERPLSPEEIDSLTADFATVPDMAATPAPSGDPAADALDVDTEALSALIDARLAEAETHVAVHDGAPQSGGDATGSADAPSSDASSRSAPEAVASPTEDSALPALGAWELLDVEDALPAPSSPRPAATPPPALPDSLADLTLVPLEVMAPVARNTDPIERWLDDAKTSTKRPEAGGGKA